MKCRVLSTSFINGSLVEPGAIVMLPEGVEPGKALEPIDPPAEPKAEPAPEPPAEPATDTPAEPKATKPRPAKPTET